MKGLSPRNLEYMRKFADSWPDEVIVQEALAWLQQPHGGGGMGTASRILPYDHTESCHILEEGEVAVKTAAREVSFGPGDFVTFPQGLDCVWTGKKAVRKHYSFS